MDIQKNLGMMDATEFRSSFNRPNLYYEVRAKTANVDKDILQEALMQASKKCFWLKNLGKFPVYKASNKLGNEIN